MMTPHETREALRAEAAKLIGAPTPNGNTGPVFGEEDMLRRMGRLADPDSEQARQDAVLDHMTSRTSGTI